MFGKFRFRGKGGGLAKMIKSFVFLGNIELYERPLIYMEPNYSEISQYMMY